MEVNRYHPGLHRWWILLAFCTLLLVAAGGLVTSRDAGLAIGAVARHEAIGTICRICGSPIVTGVVLWVSLRILLHYARNGELRLTTLTLIGMPIRVTFTVQRVAAAEFSAACIAALS